MPDRPLLTLPTPERVGPPPPAGEPARRDAAAPLAQEVAERTVLAPIQHEGRMSTFDVDGARIRVVTEAEQGRELVVRTTLARDGRELRRVETTVDEPSDGDVGRSLRELIDLQHASALQEVGRLAKGALIEPDGFRVAFKQRIPRDVSELFDSYLDKAASMEELTEDIIKRLRDQVMVRVFELSKRGAIAPTWKTADFQFHDPAVAQTLERGGGAAAGQGTGAPPGAENPGAGGDEGPA